MSNLNATVQFPVENNCGDMDGELNISRPQATAGWGALDDEGEILSVYESARIVEFDAPELGFWAPQFLPYCISTLPQTAYERMRNVSTRILMVSDDIGVAEMLGGYMPAQSIPITREEDMLRVCEDLPNAGFMQAEYAPYTRYSTSLQVERTITDSGWAQAQRLPYRWSTGYFEVIRACGDFHPGIDLPYYYHVDGELVVTEHMPEAGFAPAVELNKVNVYGYSANVLNVLGCDTPGDELVFGLELETSEVNCNLYPLAATRKGIWKEDSSCGLEFVTKPMSIVELLDFAQNAPVGTLSPDSDCGMHLHINRKALTQRQICLLALLISSEEYANEIDQIAGRRSNGYCKKVKKTEEEVLNTDDRYEAVNLTNFSPSKYTVEIRIFAGTRFNHHLVERVLWVYQLVHFVKSPFASADYGDFLAYQQKLSGFIKHLVK